MTRKTTPKLSVALDDYMALRETSRAKSTCINDRSLLNVFVREMKDCQVHQLTHAKVEAWFVKESKRQLGSSYNKVRSRTKGFLDFCHRRGWIDIDPLAEVHPRKVVRRERFQLSPHELLELPHHAKTDRDRALILTAINTALRAIDLCGLRVRDVDLAGNSLHVYIHKSSKEDTLPITTELHDALSIWLRQYEEDAGPLQPDWFLFPRREPGHGRFQTTEQGQQYEFHVYGCLIPDKQVCNVAEIVKRAMRDAGHSFGSGEGAHTIRRSVARAFFDFNVERGYDAALRATSALLHHSSSQVTEVYLGLSTEKLHRDDVLRGKSFLPAMVSTKVAKLAS